MSIIFRESLVKAACNVLLEKNRRQLLGIQVSLALQTKDFE